MSVFVIVVCNVLKLRGIDKNDLSWINLQTNVVLNYINARDSFDVFFLKKYNTLRFQTGFCRLLNFFWSNQPAVKVEDNAVK